MNSWKMLFSAFFFLWVCLGCSDDKDRSFEEDIRREYRIAVVLPFGNGMEAHWKRSIDWALENLNKALISQRQIKVSAEWYDIETYDTRELFQDLSGRNDLSAVIGPLYSADAQIAAEECSKTDKTLIVGTVSSELVMRSFAQRKFFWCLAENDISQCEVLLTRALQRGAKSVSLLTSGNEYGTTFWDWFSFQAKELGLEVKSVEQYTDDDVKEKMRQLMREDVDCLICVPYDRAITDQMNEVRHNVQNAGPFLLFSDVAFISHPDVSYEGMEGITQIHDPESGFHVSYEVRYGQAPQYGSAHFYDAVILAGLGILEADLAEEQTINEAICRLVDGRGGAICCTSVENVSQIVSELIAGNDPHITGASGKLRFDQSAYTNVLHSVYCHWIVYNGSYLILEYNTSDDSKRTDSYAANWNWKATFMQDFSETNLHSYPQQTGLYALVIATSSGWDNYRHQADAFAMYQLLKSRGLDDEHILLIAEDDIAWHEKNTKPGEIYRESDGSNVYHNIQIDHQLSEVDFSDLYDLLSGKSEKGVLPSETDNLLIYWVGHGSPQGPVWEDKVIPAAQVSDLFKRLAGEARFRKAFFAIESCYSGEIGLLCEGIPGLLCLTAANELETSKVSRYSAELGVWMSNSFSDALIDQFSSTQDMSLYKLYNTIYNRTIGSHVSVYNAPAFDNLYTSSIREFISP